MKKSLLSLCTLLASAGTLFLSSGVWAATYYVDAASGNDQYPGTQYQPYRSITTALQHSAAGDTVLIGSGTYRETLQFPRSGASMAQPIILKAQPGSQVDIKGSDQVTGWTLQSGGIWKKSGWSANSQQVFADGLPLQQIGATSPFHSMKWDTTTVLPAVGSGLSSMFPGSFFYDQAGKNLYVYLADGSDPNRHLVEASVRTWLVNTDQSYIAMDGLRFAHSNVTSASSMMGMVNITGRGWQIANCSFNYADFAGLSISGDEHQLTGNTANYNGDVGISINGSDAAHNWDRYPNRPQQNIVLVGNETSYNNYRKFNSGWQSGGLKAATSCNGVIIYQHRSLANDGTGIWFDIYSSNIRIERCTVFGNLVGIGYEISDNAIIANNLVANSKYQGIYVSAASGVAVLNNTLVQNGFSIVLHGMPRVDHPTLQNNTVSNNIISGSTVIDLVVYANPTAASGNVADYNLYDGPPKITWTMDSSYNINYTSLASFTRDTGMEAHGLNASPRFANPAVQDYSLLAGSPAIDAGSSVFTGIGNRDLPGNTRIVDGKGTGKLVIDVGAWEFQNSGAAPAQPTGLRISAS